MNWIEQAQKDPSLYQAAVFEPHEGPEIPPRFDSPVRLEDRGVTPQTRKDRKEAEKAWLQQLLWSKATIAKNSVAAKLRSIDRITEAATLEECHSFYTVAQCKGCSKLNKFPNRCDVKWCPECMPRLAHDREKTVEFWVLRIGQPKLVTLTLKNTDDFSKGHVIELKKFWTALRRRVFCKNWIGGFYSIEVTNEGNGWHLHLHALVNARWIDKGGLSDEWRSVTNGFGYIVDVADARADSFKRQVKKYVVKGTQLSAWTPTQIATFIDAFDGVRCFGVFGDLFKQRAEFSVFWKNQRKSKPVCECGCCDVYYFTEAQFLERDLRLTPNSDPIPPPRLDATPDFPALAQGHARPR